MGDFNTSQVDRVRLNRISGTPSTPPAGTMDLWIDDDDALLKTINESGTIDAVDSGGGGGGGGSVDSDVVVPATDTNVTTSNVDICSDSLTAGTYIIHGLLSGTKTTTGTVLAVIWDGTTGYGTGFASLTGGENGQVHVIARAVLGSTTTVKLTGVCDAGSFNAVKVQGTIATGTPATQMIWEKVA